MAPVIPAECYGPRNYVTWPEMELNGKRVLVVEDEPIIAMSIEDMLGDLGCGVVGPALSATQADELARNEQLDAALLDLNLGDGASFPIALILRERRVPFSFATGYGRKGVPAAFSDVPVLPKPYTQDALATILRRLLG
jgi:CheY-like chemotaxis protein